MQTMSIKGLMELAGHEAIVCEPYYDSGHVLTWGVGHTKAAGSPDPATMWGKTAPIADAVAVLHNDVAADDSAVDRAFTRALSQTERDAADSFQHNTGAITYATWVKKFNAGDRAGAVSAIMSWSKPASIIPRRKKEQLLFDKGIYSNGGMASVYQTDGKGNVQWGTGRRVDLRPILSPPAPVKLPPAPNVLQPAQPAPAPTPAPAIKVVAPEAASIAIVTAKAHAAAPTLWGRIVGFFAGLFHRA